MNPTTLPDVLDFANVANPFSFAYLALLAGAICRMLRTQTGDQILASVLAVIPGLKSMVPAKAVPWVACILAGLVTLGNAKINAHADWPHAFALTILGAMLGGGAASGGHETVGKLVAKLSATPTDPTAPKDPPKSPGSNGLMRLALVVAAVLILAGSVFTPDNLRAERAASGAIAAAGCTPQEAKTVVDVGLTLEQAACLGLSELADEPQALLETCKIASSPAVHDFVKSFLVKRAAARKVTRPCPTGVIDQNRSDGGK